MKQLVEQTGKIAAFVMEVLSSNPSSNEHVVVDTCCLDEGEPARRQLPLPQDPLAPGRLAAWREGAYRHL